MSSEFITYRSTHTFHVGALERDIQKGEEVEYDGLTLKIGDTKHVIPTIQGAIKLGWLVLASDKTSVYRPQASQVVVHPATSVGRERGAKVESTTVHEEDRDLGKLGKVRDRGDGIVRKMGVLAEEGSSEGVPVGRINSPTHMKAEFTPGNEMRLKQEVLRVDNTQGVPTARVTPIRTARDEFAEAVIVGDTTGARAGDAIADLLGEEGAVVARLPPVSNRNPLGEGDSPHLTATEKAERAADNAAAIRAARDARVAAANASAAKLGVGPLANQARQVDTTNQARQVDTTVPDESAQEEMESLPADLGQKVMLVRAVIPNFTWDMTRPWMARATDAVKRYGKNPLYLNGILSVETDTVKNHIVRALTPKA